MFWETTEDDKCITNNDVGDYWKWYMYYWQWCGRLLKMIHVLFTMMLWWILKVFFFQLSSFIKIGQYLQDVSLNIFHALWEMFQKFEQYGKCPKFHTPKFLTKWIRQCKPRSDCYEVVWSGSTLFAIPLGVLRNNCIKIFRHEKYGKDIYRYIFT